jgi:galactokinase
MARGSDTASPDELRRDAEGALVSAFGGGPSSASAAAPGRCTIVGEHVDYAGGLVLCTAIDLHVAVAVRAAAGARDRVVLDGTPFEAASRSRLRPDGAGYVFAAAAALRDAAVGVPPFEAATSASLPPGAGLASSAATVLATTAALLRLGDLRLDAAALIDVAYRAEHDVLGVASGRLDQHAIVETPDGSALLLDSAADTVSSVPWRLDGSVLCICDTGVRHRVSGRGYRTRRSETEVALRKAGATSAQDVGALPSGADLGARRLRHVVTESRRAAAAAIALERGDSVELGRLMSESHRSLRDDQEISTPLLDAVVAAAEATAGCHGARLVGAGFGGSVLALADAAAAPACMAAMRGAAGKGSSAWIAMPAPGLAATAGANMGRG